MIKKIQLKNFRNLENVSYDFNNNIIFFSGNNGSGKTSILESIYYISTTKSFRTSIDDELIMYDKPFASIKLETNKKNYEVVVSKKGKRLFIDKVEKRKLSNFIGDLKVVLFSSYDLELIDGSPSFRRQFLDLEQMKLNKSYIKCLNDYKNALKQRNSLLKRMKVTDEYVFLDIIGSQILEFGKSIIENRRNFINDLNIEFKKRYKKFSNYNVEVIYTPNVEVDDLEKHLFKNQKQDILYEQTLVGPHRDDFKILVNGVDVKSFASSGEKRLIVLAIKLGLLEVIKNHFEDDDIYMLLDDVLSDLDLENQKIFINELPSNRQIIMNSANKIDFDNVFEIKLERNELDE